VLAPGLRADKIDLNVHRRNDMTFDPVHGERHRNSVPLHVGPTLRDGTLGKVTTGTIVGYVGNSGDAINSASHDHFEWHPGNGAAVDPFPYLNAVCLLPSETTNETSA